MEKIEIYTKNFCPYCARAKAVLDDLGLTYREYEVTFDVAKEAQMNSRSGRFTVPQIFVNDRSIGGSDELIEMVEEGRFLNLLDTSYPAIRDSIKLDHEETSHV